MSAPEDKQSRNALADHNRYTGLLFQGLAREVYLVFEGLKLRLDQLHRERRSYLDQQFSELRAIIVEAYADLNERVERLEQQRDT